MDRESRLLSHNKANYTRLVTQKPSNAEGANGDFAVGSTANGIALFAKINNIWYEFAADVAMEEVSRVAGTAWHIYNAFNNDHNDHTFFVALNRSTNTYGSLTSGDVSDFTSSHCLLLPYDTRVISMSVWGQPVLGDVTVSIHNVPNGSKVNSSDSTQLVETSPTVNFGAAYKTRTINFSGNYTLKAGSQMYVKFVVNGGSNVTWTGQGEGDSYNMSFILTLDFDVPV